MKHRASANRWPPSALMGAALLGNALLGGCSSVPLGPGTNAIVNPEFIRVAAPPPGAFGSLPSGPISGSNKIDGTKGGKLTVGRFAVTVPAGAYAGPATLTILVPDQAVLLCDLSITPAAANSFKVPVKFTTDFSGTNVTDPTTLIEIWYDASAGVWRQVPGTQVDTAKLTVAVPLSHFSDYGTVDGKAGW